MKGRRNSLPLYLSLSVPLSLVARWEEDGPRATQGRGVGEAQERACVCSFSPMTTSLMMDRIM